MATEQERMAISEKLSQEGRESTIEALMGSLKGITTDIPGLVADIVSYAKDPSKGFAPEGGASARWFESLTGYKTKDSISEMVGGAINPVGAAKAMIIGVPRAPGATKSLLNFLRSEERGISPAQNMAETGLYRGSQDAKVRSVLSDAPARLDPKAFFKSEGKFYVEDQAKLGDVLKHPDLYKQLPQLAEYSMDIGRGAPGSASFNPQTRTIKLAGDFDLDRLLSTTLHETQHAVQRKEGFIGGGSPSQFLNIDVDAARAALQRQLDTTRDPATRDAILRANVRLTEKENEAKRLYFNIPGEQEARFTESTRNLSQSDLQARVVNMLSSGVDPQTALYRRP